jgi:hypothetical protein
VCLYQASAFCQSDPTFEQGVVPNRYYLATGIDTINTMNGNLMLHIPLASLPQRGRLKLSFSLGYNGSNWSNVQRCTKASKTPIGGGTVTICDRVYGRGSVGPQPVEDSTVAISASHPTGPGPGSLVYATNKVSLVDSSGATHPLGYDASNLAHLRSTDGSGYLFVPSDPLFYKSNSLSPPAVGVVYDSQGVARTYGANGYWAGGLVSVTDPNGNRIQYHVDGNTGSATYTDTLGRSVPDPSIFYEKPMSSSTVGCPAINAANQPLVGTQAWIIPGPNGVPQTYLFCYASVSFSQGTTGAVSGDSSTVRTMPAIQAVVLPNKTYWGFVYDSTDSAGSGAFAYGDLLEVITPEAGR